jgi:hypothetical protein
LACESVFRNFSLNVLLLTLLQPYYKTTKIVLNTVEFIIICLNIPGSEHSFNF